jgi:hypothetical protein
MEFFSGPEMLHTASFTPTVQICPNRNYAHRRKQKLFPIAHSLGFQHRRLSSMLPAELQDKGGSVEAHGGKATIERAA